MDRDEIIGVIKENLIQTIEEMGFVFLYDGVETVEQDGSDSVCVTIDVHGRIIGRIGLICSAGLAQTIAQNILCLDAEELDGAMINDSIAEILNTIAGRVMESTSQDCNYTISLPQFECFTQGEKVSLLNMAADEGNVSVVLEF